jgi:exonuclease SbcD
VVGTIRPVKLLHTSDWHVGRAIRGRSRVEEHRAVLEEIAAIGATHEVDLILVAGDLFDVATPTPEAERIVYRALLDLADQAPVVIVAGNHDNPRRLQAVAPLLELGRIRVVSHVRRPDEGGVIDDLDIPVRLAPVPWLSQRGIVTAAAMIEADADEHVQTYIDRIQRIIAALTTDLDPSRVNVLIGHLMVHGAELTGSERAMQTNHPAFDYSIPALAFPGALSYVALGHLHRLQRVPAACEVWYSGAPMQLDFGEAGLVKGVLVVEAEPGLPASVTEVPITRGRRLVQVEGTLAQIEAQAEGLDDAYVKVVVDESARVGLADEIRRLVPGAVDVAVARPDLPDRSGDSTPVRLGRPPAELFGEYLAGKRISDPDLVRLFSEVLEEAEAGGGVDG